MNGKLWGNDIINSLIVICIYSYRLVKKCFLKICETSKCHNFLILQPIFIRFSLFCSQLFTLSSEIKLNLFWISSLTIQCIWYVVQMAFKCEEKGRRDLNPYLQPAWQLGWYHRTTHRLARRGTLSSLVLRGRRRGASRSTSLGGAPCPGAWRPWPGQSLRFWDYLWTKQKQFTVQVFVHQWQTNNWRHLQYCEMSKVVMPLSWYMYMQKHCICQKSRPKLEIIFALYHEEVFRCSLFTKITDSNSIKEFCSSDKQWKKKTCTCIGQPHLIQSEENSTHFTRFTYNLYLQLITSIPKDAYLTHNDNSTILYFHVILWDQYSSGYFGIKTTKQLLVYCRLSWNFRTCTSMEISNIITMTIFNVLDLSNCPQS